MLERLNIMLNKTTFHCSRFRNCPISRSTLNVQYNTVGWLANPGPATFGGPIVWQKFIKYARMYHFKKKIQKNFPQRGPVKMFEGPARTFPRAPLWLSTGLIARRLIWCLHVAQCWHDKHFLLANQIKFTIKAGQQLTPSKVKTIKLVLVTHYDVRVTSQLAKNV